MDGWGVLICGKELYSGQINFQLRRKQMGGDVRKKRESRFLVQTRVFQMCPLHMLRMREEMKSGKYGERKA